MKKLFSLIALLASPVLAVNTSDVFGYHLTDIPFSYNNISASGTLITSGSWVGGADDGYFQLSLPFNFHFYGSLNNKVSISNNGYLQFGSNSAYSGHDDLLSNLSPNNIAAAYWTDLDLSLAGTVHTLISGVPGSQTVTIQFTGVAQHSGGGNVSFQFVLYEASNNIEVRYLSTSSHNSGLTASAGLRGLFDCPNHGSLPFSYNSPQLTDNLALLYAYPSPEPACGSPTVSPSFSVSPTFSHSPTISPTFSVSPTLTISPTATPSATMSASPSSSPTPTITRTPVLLSDAFGYQAQSAPFAWLDISSSGVLVPAWAGGTDDGSYIYSFPNSMSFRFYGAGYDKVAISSNGYLQFGTSSSDFGNNCLSANSPPGNIIALFWMDLDPGLPGGAVYTKTFGSPGSQVFVVQFENVQKQGGGGIVSAEALLFEGSNQISLRWKDSSSLGFGSSAVAGLRSLFNCPNHTSLPLSCNQSVIGSLSQVDFSYPVPEPACGTMTPSPSFSVSPSFTHTFTVTQSFSSSPTITATPTISNSFTESPTFSVSPTISATFTTSASFTISPTISLTFTISETFTTSTTFTQSPTISPSPSVSPSATTSPTITRTATASPSPSASPSISPSFSRSPTSTISASATRTATATSTSTASPSATPTATKSATPSSTITLTSTPTPTFTHTPTSTVSPFPPATKPACAVLGEPDFTTSTGIALGAASLSLTSGVALDLSSFPYRLYVADKANHRILIFLDAGAVPNGGPADGVIGQAGFVSVAANRGGAPAANTLSSPGGIDIDSNGDLWVSDSGNNRVLRFSKPVPLSGAAASRVLGQGGGFNSGGANFGGVSAQSLSNPLDLSIDSNQHMAVADSGNHRVLRYDLSSASDTAVNQWGQASFNASLPNRGGTTAADSLLNPSGVLININDVWVSDTGNNRIVRYGLLFVSSTATMQLGQASFTGGLANQGFVLPGPSSLKAPAGLSMDSSLRLFVADSLNHRVLGFDPPYASNATLLYGQPGVFSGSAGCANDLMNTPLALKANVSGNLVVADSANHRLLYYGCSSGVGAATATPTNSPSGTFSSTRTPSPTRSATYTISATHSPTLTATETPSFSFSPTRSLTPTYSATHTLTSTETPSFTLTPSPSITQTVTLSSTPYIAPTQTPYPHPLQDLISYPNPALRSSGGSCLAFPVGTAATATIYDLWLQEVRRLDPSAISAVNGLACWNLRNNSGEPLAPGIYYIRVVVDGKGYLGKMTVI